MRRNVVLTRKLSALPRKFSDLTGTDDNRLQAGRYQITDGEIPIIDGQIDNRLQMERYQIIDGQIIDIQTDQIKQVSDNG